MLDLKNFPCFYQICALTRWLFSLKEEKKMFDNFYRITVNLMKSPQMYTKDFKNLN